MRLRLSLGLKKSYLFPVTLPIQVFTQKNPYPKVFSALTIPSQRETCIKHTFLTKKIMQKKKKLPTYLPYFFRTITGNKQFLFLGLTGHLRSQEESVKYLLTAVCSEGLVSSWMNESNKSVAGRSCVGPTAHAGHSRGCSLGVLVAIRRVRHSQGHMPLIMVLASRASGCLFGHPNP